MKTSFLDFEQPIAELEGKIETLRFAQDDSAVDISEEITRLEQKGQTLTEEIYANSPRGRSARWRVILSDLTRSITCV